MLRLIVPHSVPEDYCGPPEDGLAQLSGLLQLLQQLTALLRGLLNSKLYRAATDSFLALSRCSSSLPRFSADS